jgi:hypothetical protein
MTFIYYTANGGRYYVNGTWLGNFYVDGYGNKRDMQTQSLI